MELGQARGLLKKLLSEIEHPGGGARTNDYPGLRQVDAKVREGRMVIGQIPHFGEHLAAQMQADTDFAENSRRVRLEALATYCHTALRFIAAGAAQSGVKKLYRAPDTSRLTKVLPALQPIIEQRWLEAQKCQHAGAHLSAIVMMGSILEALLLARAHADPAAANRASASPKERNGKPRPLQEWSLSALIDVAAEVGWIKIDRKGFSHALRMSRNVVHPWEHASVRADFDGATCELSWQALKAAVDDMLATV